VSPPEPLRGDVYDCRFPPPSHPGVVLTVNSLIGRFDSVVVVLITGTPGPRPLRIPVGPAAGLTVRAESYVDPATIFTVGKARLHRRRGRLSAGELSAVEQGIATVIGLELAGPG
jgi:mRNA-degrading endonuclease toxin of MazEF toxin-antitoxin module